MTITVKPQINTASIIRREKVGQAEAKMRTAIEFSRLADPYVPYSNNHTEHLAQTVSRSPYSQGKIVYDTSYASAVYNRDNKTTNWNRKVHPMAMSHWGDYVAEKYKTELARTFERALKGEM